MKKQVGGMEAVVATTPSEAATELIPLKVLIFNINY